MKHLALAAVLFVALVRPTSAGSETAIVPGTITFRDCPKCPEMLVVPAGWFMMGSNRAPDEKPVHRVTITEPFAVGWYEVTFEEWETCVADGGCGGYRPPDSRHWGRDRRPVINVSWNNAQEYVRWISHKTEKQYRLLTEAEWEYVARAGTRTKFWWGNAPGDNHGNCATCRKPFDFSGTAPVGSFRPNGFGLYDTEGNVQEWVEDCWQPSYNDAPTNGSVRATEHCERRVNRGAAWNAASYAISSFRDWNRPNNRNEFIGFRVARTVDDAELTKLAARAKAIQKQPIVSEVGGARDP